MAIKRIIDDVILEQNLSDIRQIIDTEIDNLYNKIMGITDADSTTVDEAFDTLKEVANYIKTGDGSAGTELINKIATIEELLNNKVNAETGKSLISNTEIERLSKVDNYDDTEIRGLINGKVNTEAGKSLISNTEIQRLANVDNYDDSGIKTLINGKVDKVSGKSLIADSEIERLSKVDNYDDTSIKSSINKKVDKVSGKSLVSDTEIERLSTLKNYDDSSIKTLINKKVDAVTGKSLIADSEIERLSKVENYDDTGIKEYIDDQISGEGTVEFTSNDDTSATEWAPVSKLNSGITLSLLCTKISTMFKNIRYLYSQITTLNSDVTALNSDLVKKKTIINTTTESGAFNTGLDITKYDIVCARVVDTMNIFAFPRSDEYLMCVCVVNTSLIPYGNSAITVDVWYKKK